MFQLYLQLSVWNKSKFGRQQRPNSALRRNLEDIRACFYDEGKDVLGPDPGA